jgi:hypothetical protein
LKVLISTFGRDDFEKVVQAMRRLPYERLVLVGGPEAAESMALARIRELEELSGHEVTDETVPESGFMEIVDAVCEILERHSRGARGRRNDIILNISGGDKLLGDAALFAAFRLGVETYHCDERFTKLPVLKGLTAKDRFTPSQVRFIKGVDGPSVPFDRLVESISPGNRQPVERVMRELKKAGLIETEVMSGKIIIALSESGAEVARAIRTT